MAKQNSRKQTSKTSNTRKVEKPETAIDLGSQLAATPLTFVKQFGEEMDRLFDDFGLGRGLLNSIGRELGQGSWRPQVEMFEREGQLVVRADLPGMTKEDVNVEVSDGGITIEGERRGEKEEKREGFYRSERHYGKFYRRLPLPEGIQPENATATFRDGVLEVTMDAPRRVESKARRLSIRVESQPQAKSKAA